MKTEPSLFVFDAGDREVIVDLAKIALMAKRAGGSYWLRMVGGDVDRHAGRRRHVDPHCVDRVPGQVQPGDGPLVMARADYDRFLAELEQVLNRMGAINVAGIEPGIVDELTARMRDLVGLKQKARFVGARTEG